MGRETLPRRESDEADESDPPRRHVAAALKSEIARNAAREGFRYLINFLTELSA